MKTVIEKVGDRVSIQLEAEEGDTAEDTAHAFVQVNEIIKEEQEEES